jgi:hypothetical protein
MSLSGSSDDDAVALRPGMILTIYKGFGEVGELSTYWWWTERYILIHLGVRRGNIFDGSSYGIIVEEIMEERMYYGSYTHRHSLRNTLIITPNLTGMTPHSCHCLRNEGIPTATVRVEINRECCIIEY